MKQTRLLTLLALLAGVLIVRWWDPLSKSRPSSEPDIAAAVVRAASSANAGQAVTSSATLQPEWPARDGMPATASANAFLTRSEVAQKEAQRQQAQMAKAPVYVPPPPPPPPPPPEPAPPLQVIGTWGTTQDMAVFLATPNGTLLAHPGDMLMATYKVQAITPQHITLVQSNNQKVWTLDIPSAPSQLQTWPGR